ncbi:MAG: hypothetical protein AAF694_30890 [Bacteroidota bacterium]
MTSLITILVFLGFYLWYATSKRIKIEPLLGIEPWSQQKNKESKLLGSLFLSLALGASMYGYGIGAGAFLFIVVLMTLGCLIILIIPLNIINRTVLILMFALAMLMEILY